jgi:GH18 family chitinase
MYTHIHFAFANVTRDDFRVEITDPVVLEQFQTCSYHPYFNLKTKCMLTKRRILVKNMSGIKKIISLGGWAFSTEPGTFSILREATQPANREKFKSNLISFMNEHNLDGIDLDWEYPGVSHMYRS